jgi:hypothetical protein
MHSADKITVLQDSSASSSVSNASVGLLAKLSQTESGGHGIFPSKSSMGRHQAILALGSDHMLDEVLKCHTDIVAMDISKVICGILVAGGM